MWKGGDARHPATSRGRQQSVRGRTVGCWQIEMFADRTTRACINVSYTTYAARGRSSATCQLTRVKRHRTQVIMPLIVAEHPPIKPYTYSLCPMVNGGVLGASALPSFTRGVPRAPVADMFPATVQLGCLSANSCNVRDDGLEATYNCRLLTPRPGCVGRACLRGGDDGRRLPF